MPFPSTEHQFRPGNRANPGGRPKGQSISSKLRELLERHEIGGKPIKDGRQVADLVAEAIIVHATKGDYRFMELLVNRVDGKLTERIEVGPSAATEAIRELLRGAHEQTEPTEEAS